MSFNNSFPLPDGMQTRLSMGALRADPMVRVQILDLPFSIISIGKVLHVFEPQFPNRVPFIDFMRLLQYNVSETLNKFVRVKSNQL